MGDEGVDEAREAAVVVSLRVGWDLRRGGRRRRWSGVAVVEVVVVVVVGLAGNDVLGRGALAWGERWRCSDAADAVESAGDGTYPDGGPLLAVGKRRRRPAGWSRRTVGLVSPSPSSGWCDAGSGSAHFAIAPWSSPDPERATATWTHLSTLSLT